MLLRTSSGIYTVISNSLLLILNTTWRSNDREDVITYIYLHGRNSNAFALPFPDIIEYAIGSEVSACIEQQAVMRSSMIGLQVPHVGAASSLIPL